MIAELGLAALWLAAALAALQLICGILVVRKDEPTLASVIRPVAVMQGVLAAIAFGAVWGAATVAEGTTLPRWVIIASESAMIGVVAATTMRSSLQVLTVLAFPPLTAALRRGPRGVLVSLVSELGALAVTALALSGSFAEQEVTDLFKAIAANSAMVDGHAAQMSQLAAGKYAVAMSTYDYQTAGVAKTGAPLSYEPVVQPIVQRPNGVALMNSAPHPAAAYLFYVWILTDGQQVLREAGLTSALKKDAGAGLADGDGWRPVA